MAIICSYWPWTHYWTRSERARLLKVRHLLRYSSHHPGNPAPRYSLSEAVTTHDRFEPTDGRSSFAENEIADRALNEATGRDPRVADVGRQTLVRGHQIHSLQAIDGSTSSEYDLTDKAAWPF